ncbi:hypothetical protein L195_g062882, partial [Trifolium pratense]
MLPALPDLGAATLPVSLLIGAMIGVATGAAKGGEIGGGATDKNLVALRARSTLTPRSSNHAR